MLLCCDSRTTLRLHCTALTDCMRDLQETIPQHSAHWPPKRPGAAARNQRCALHKGTHSYVAQATRNKGTHNTHPQAAPKPTKQYGPASTQVHWHGCARGSCFAEPTTKYNMLLSRMIALLCCRRQHPTAYDFCKQSTLAAATVQHGRDRRACYGLTFKPIYHR